MSVFDCVCLVSLCMGLRLFSNGAETLVSATQDELSSKTDQRRETPDQSHIRKIEGNIADQIEVSYKANQNRETLVQNHNPGANFAAHEFHTRPEFHPVASDSLLNSYADDVSSSAHAIDQVSSNKLEFSESNILRKPEVSETNELPLGVIQNPTVLNQFVQDRVPTDELLPGHTLDRGILENSQHLGAYQSVFHVTGMPDGNPGFSQSRTQLSNSENHIRAFPKTDEIYSRDSNAGVHLISREQRDSRYSSPLDPNQEERFRDPHVASHLFNQFRHEHILHKNILEKQRIPHQQFSNAPWKSPPDNSVVIPSNSRVSEDDFISLTIIVYPGIKQCIFYSPNSNFVIDYQVIRGGILDVGLFVRTPDGEPLVTRPPSPEATLSIKVPSYFLLQPYTVCLDNRKGSYAEKHVALSIDLDINWENPSEYERAAIETLRKRSFASAQIEALDAEFMRTWETIISQLENLFGRLRRIEHLQQKSNNFASIDQALMEANLQRVTGGSVIQIFIMLSVAAVQLLLIRALFDRHTLFSRFWFVQRPKLTARC